MTDNHNDQTLKPDTQSPDAQVAQDVPPPEAPAVPQAEPLGFGPALRSERERQGISLNEIAGRLRLHPRQIAALEEENLQALPALPFVRGFLRNYAKELKIDAEPLLGRLASRVGPPPEAVPAASTQSEPQAGFSRLPAGDSGSRQVVLTSVVGGLVVLGVIGWVASRGSAPPPAGPDPVEQRRVQALDATAQPAVPVAPPGEPAAVPPTDGAAGAVAAAPADASAADGAAAGAQPAGDGAAGQAVRPAEAAKEAARPVQPVPANPGRNVLRLSFKGRPSWIEVIQADGRVLWAGMNEADTERLLIGQPPLRLLIGNASSVSVEYRGRAVDLKPHIRADDLARLTVE